MWVIVFSNFFKFSLTFNKNSVQQNFQKGHCKFDFSKIWNSNLCYEKFIVEIVALPKYSQKFETEK